MIMIHPSVLKIWKDEGGCYWNQMVVVLLLLLLLLMVSNLGFDSATTTTITITTQVVLTYNCSSFTTMDGLIDGMNGFEVIPNELDPFEREQDIPTW
jgi:hypothetical protein